MSVRILIMHDKEVSTSSQLCMRRFKSHHYAQIIVKIQKIIERISWIFSKNSSIFAKIPYCSNEFPRERHFDYLPIHHYSCFRKTYSISLYTPGLSSVKKLIPKLSVVFSFLVHLHQITRYHYYGILKSHPKAQESS